MGRVLIYMNKSRLNQLAVEDELFWASEQKSEKTWLLGNSNRHFLFLGEKDENGENKGVLFQVPL